MRVRSHHSVLCFIGFSLATWSIGPARGFTSDTRGAALNAPATSLSFKSHGKTWSLQKSSNHKGTIDFSLRNLNDDEAFSEPDAAGTGLVGRYGLTANDVLVQIAPHIAQSKNVSLKLEKTFAEADGVTIHETYRLWFGDLPIVDSYLSLHHHRNRLVLIKADIPEFRLPAEPFDVEDMISPANLGFVEESPQIQQKAEAVLASSGGFAAPAWRLWRLDLATGISRTLVVEAQTGAILQDEITSFAATSAPKSEVETYKADIFSSSPLDVKVSRVVLDGLKPTDHLDGDHFTVYGSTADAYRVTASHFLFSVEPDESGNRRLFDQVSAYHGAMRAYDFFASEFGYDMGSSNVPIFIGAGNDGNAYYNPADQTIRIGDDNDSLHNLARDTDVIAHEFSHHVVAASLTGRSGQAGILHEGYADYFAFAMSGDPHLAKSISSSLPYLRTALLPSSDRFDDLDVRKWNLHDQSQLWSAVLWQLRTSIGDKAANKLVYGSIHYLGASSGFGDAFLGLLNADRDQHPLAQDDPDAGIFGENKCAILNAGIGRGFAPFLTDYDGTSCGLDLTELAKASAENLVEEKKGHPKPQFMGVDCAVVKNANKRGATPVAALLFLPVLILLWTSRGLVNNPREKKDGPYGS